MESKQIKKDSVMILIPCSGDVDPKVMCSLATLAVTSTKNGYPIEQVCIIERTLIHTARNTLARNLLNSNCEWGFWMDDDMLLDTGCIPKLINAAKNLKTDFTTGIYYQRVDPHRPLAMITQPGKRFVHHHVNPSTDKPIRIDACGFGCALTHRDMFKKIEFPYFQYITGEHDVSEDFYFCVKAKEAGIPLWALPNIECIHLGAKAMVSKTDYKEEPTDKIKLTVAQEEK